MAYKNCVVVCTSRQLQREVQNLLRNKNRDEIFENPFVYGQTIHYVPDEGCTDAVSASFDYECSCLFEEQIVSLNGLKGFENALAFDKSGFIPTKAVCIAKYNGNIIGIAGAAKTTVDRLWEVGVDVMEGYRNGGLGTYLVRGLTKELLIKNIVPFYSASVTNIGSQMVANRCGYRPLWVDTFGTVLDGSSVYNDVVNVLNISISGGN